MIHGDSVVRWVSRVTSAGTPAQGSQSGVMRADRASATRNARVGPGLGADAQPRILELEMENAGAPDRCVGQLV